MLLVGVILKDLGLIVVGLASTLAEASYLPVNFDMKMNLSYSE